SEIDPATGERIIHTIVDFLPEQWGRHNRTAGPVDSLGRPIVNETPGLPGWAQADVDALRAAIEQWIAIRAEQSALEQPLRETDGILGNFIGQAIIRDIDFDDLLSLDDSTVVSDS